MSLRLRAKIALIAVGAVAVGLVVVLATSAYLFGQAYGSSLQSRSMAIAQNLRVQMDRVLQIGIRMEDILGFDKQCRDVVDTYGEMEFAMVVGPDGRVLFHNDTTRMGSQLTTPGLLAAVRRPAESTVGYGDGGTAGYAAVAPIVGTDGSHLGSVVVGLPARVIDEKKHNIVAILFGVGLLCLAAGTLVLLKALSVFVMRPLDPLITSVERVRADTSDLNRRVRVNSDDELGSLAHSFNGLMQTLQETTVSKASLEAAFDALQESEERFRSALDHAPIGMAVLSLDGRFIQVNRALCDLVGYEPDELHALDARAIVLAGDLHLDEDYVRRMESGEIRCYETEMRYRRKDGRMVWVQVTGTVLRDSAGAPKQIIKQVQDINERKEMERRLEYQAHMDFLTGLANRGHFLELAEREVARARRYHGPLSVAMLDLDHFKTINDSYGHEAGDAVLREFAIICRNALRGLDVVGRMGGEEFAILFPETAASQAFEVAERLRLAIAAAEIVTVDARTIRCTASLGIAELGAADRNIDGLLGRADQCLYQAKRSGRNQTCLATTGIGRDFHVVAI